MNPNPDASLLLGCLQVEDDHSKNARLKNYSPMQWRSTLDLARAHGVMPLLYWHLKRRIPGIEIPADGLTELRHSSLGCSSKNLFLYHELTRALAAFQAGKLPAIVLKGAHLAEIVYPDIALRPMADIDLLVKQSDLQRASELLLDQGYTPYRHFQVDKEVSRHHHLPPFLKHGVIVFELHWNIAPPASPLKIDLACLWDRAQPATIAGVPTLVLSPGDLLLHLSLHLCLGKFKYGLRHLCDVTEIVASHREELDWQQIILQAREWGASKCLFLALFLACELLGAPIPAYVLKGLRPDDFSAHIEALAKDRVLAAAPAAPIHPDLVALWGGSSLRRKAASVLRALFPSHDYMARRYSLPPGSKRVTLYYLVRLKDLSRQYARQVWRLARREQAATAFSSQENRLNDWWASS